MQSAEPKPGCSTEKDDYKAYGIPMGYRVTAAGTVPIPCNKNKNMVFVTALKKYILMT